MNNLLQDGSLTWSEFIGLIIAFASIALIYIILFKKKFTRKYQQEKKQMVQKFAVGMAEAEQIERSRVASNLHDGIGQILVAAKLNLKQLSTASDVLSPNQKKALDTLDQLLVKSSQETKRISKNLMPEDLEEFGLIHSLNKDAEAFNASKQVRVNLSFEGIDDKSIDKHLEINIYRIIQEFIANSVIHAQADNIYLDLKRENGTISIHLSDDGIGYDLAGLKCKNKGLGVESMRNRITTLNGEYRYESVEGKGTNLTMRFDV